MTRTVLVLVVPVLLLAACGGGTHAQRPVDHAPTQAHDDALATHLAEVGRALGGAGLEGRGELARGFLSGGEPATFAVEIPARRCSAFVSFASPGLHDLDATLFAPDGTELASDTEPDAHPTVVACAGDTARRGYVHVRAYSGAGAFVLAAFDGEDRALPALQHVLGGRPGIAAAEGQASADAARIREFILGVGRRGFEQRGDTADVRLADGQHVRVPLPVEPNVCVTVGAFATGQLRETDLRILDEEGREVARDFGTLRDASVQACSDRRAEWTAEVIATTGAGGARVVVLTGDEAQTGGTGSLWLGERDASLAAAAAPPAAVPGALLAVRGTLASGEAVSHVGQVAPFAQAASCVRVVATPGRGTPGLSLLVTDAHHVHVGSRDAAGGGVPTVLHVCDAPVPLTVVVSARGGGGEYTLDVRSVAEPSGAPEDLRSALLDADADAVAAGLLRDSTQAPARAAPLAVRAGECVRVVRLAHGRAPAHVALSDDHGVIAESTGLRPRASACAPAGAARPMTIRADEGADALLVVYRRAADAGRAASPAP